MRTIEQVLDLDKMRTEIAELEEQAAAPDLWDDQANAQRLTGRLNALQGEMNRLFDKTVRDAIVDKFKLVGFSYVSLDLQGYRTGSMNEVLSKKTI
jgi:PP-loop superfamily ATP-utilizing enzyme